MLICSLNPRVFVHNPETTNCFLFPEKNEVHLWFFLKYKLNVLRREVQIKNKFDNEIHRFWYQQTREFQKFIDSKTNSKCSKLPMIFYLLNLNSLEVNEVDKKQKHKKIELNCIGLQQWIRRKIIEKVPQKVSKICWLQKIYEIENDSIEMCWFIAPNWSCNVRCGKQFGGLF